MESSREMEPMIMMMMISRGLYGSHHQHFFYYCNILLFLPVPKVRICSSTGLFLTRNELLLDYQNMVIVINDQFPGPLLNTTTNDVVNINVRNINLTEPFLLTWNGVQQRKNSWQDGVRRTNCPIPPGTNWTYIFQMKDQIGSFFYFSDVALPKGGRRIWGYPYL